LPVVVKKGEAITLADLPAGEPLLIAFLVDPLSKIVRDGSRLNEVLLVRLESADFSAETRARAADGTVVAYSAICTHTGCDEWDWQRASGTIKCPCHVSEFALKDSAWVMNGPAPRRVPALPLTIVDDVPVVAGGFVGHPGFEAGGG
jgi:rieske iron-sulfur protein